MAELHETSAAKINSSVTFYSEKAQWLNPVQLGTATLLDLSTQPATLLAVLEVLEKLESDEVMDFVKDYYKTGLERFGDNWNYADSLTVLYVAAKILQPQTYLEIGVFHGRSMATVASLAPNCQLYGFDLWIEDYAHSHNPGPSLVQSQLQRVGYQGEALFISGDSKQTLPKFLEEQPDLFFDLVNVDGDHSEAGARRDLETALPRVKVGGVIVFDDIRHPKHPWLERVWDEVVGSNSNFLSIKYTEVGHGVAFAIRYNTNAVADAVHGDALARVARLSSLVAELQLERESLETEQSARNQIIARLGEELETIRADRAAKEEVIAQLSGELEAIRADRAAKEEVIARLSGELEAVRADQAAKEELITRLQTMLKAKESIVSHLGYELAEYRALGWGLARFVTLKLRKLRQTQPAAPVEPKKTNEASGDTNTVHTNISRGPLQVGLDVLQIQSGVSGGVEVYMKTLVRALTREANQAVKLTLLCNRDQIAELREIFGDQVSYYSFPVEPVAALGAAVRRAVSGNTVVPEGARANVSFARLKDILGIDILHSPVQIFSQVDFNVPGVLNLHDLQHLHYPENFSEGDLAARNQLYPQSAHLASAVIASSDFVRRDIVERMGIPAWKVHTVPVAFDPDVEEGLCSFTPELAKQTYQLPETFAFYPAQFWLHKNHARLIEALAIVRAQAPQHDFKLVLSGYRHLSGWASVEQALKAHNLHDHVQFLDFIPTEHLGAIYRLATFCMMPSLFEASSYPVIEAQMLGCPAMCSNITSLPELMSGGAGLLFDPLSPEDMADKMLRWLNDPADRLAYAERGQRRARQYHSLAEYTSRMVNIYSTVVDLYPVVER